MSSVHSIRAPASAAQRAYLYSCPRCISTTAPFPSGSASDVGPSPRAMQAAIESAIPADAPGTTRAASLPHSEAISRPEESSSSSIAAHVEFASAAAAHAEGPRTDPPRSV
jgi:hypothetical protein